MLTAEAQLDALFAALSDPVRRHVIGHLRDSPRRAGELARLLKLSPPALSRHLRALRQAGLVAEQALQEDARVRVYQLLPAGFSLLRDWLGAVAEAPEGRRLPPLPPVGFERPARRPAPPEAQPAAPSRPAIVQHSPDFTEPG